jgi:hypothetical protein
MSYVKHFAGGAFMPCFGMFAIRRKAAHSAAGAKYAPPGGVRYNVPSTNVKGPKNKSSHLSHLSPLSHCAVACLLRQAIGNRH